MKKVPLLLCCLLGIILLPWHLILPETPPPYPDLDVGLSVPTVEKYRAHLKQQGTTDPRSDDQVILALGRVMVSKGAQAEAERDDPYFVRRLANLEWENRPRSYFVRLLENIYGSRSISPRAIVVPVILALVYGVLISTITLFQRRTSPDK